MRILLRLVSTAVALAVAAWLFAGIRFGGASHGSAEVQDKLLPLIVVAAILGIITSFVKPIVTLFSLPVIILSLGLFLFVINAAMLLLTSALADALGIRFHVDGFWSAVGGSIVITIITWIVDGFLGTKDRERR